MRKSFENRQRTPSKFKQSYRGKFDQPMMYRTNENPEVEQPVSRNSNYSIKKGFTDEYQLE